MTVGDLKKWIESRGIKDDVRIAIEIQTEEWEHSTTAIHTIYCSLGGGLDRTWYGPELPLDEKLLVISG